MQLLTENNVREIQLLEQKLLNYYKTTTTYAAFDVAAISQHEKQWTEMLHVTRNMFPDVKKLKILEIGAGRTGFKKYLEEKSVDDVEFHCQDVTEKNIDYLSVNSDKVYIGNINEIKERFHLVFHSYVFEHISRPLAFLKQIDLLLHEKGVHCIECPKYDFALYLPHSLDHFSLLKRIVFKIKTFFHSPPFAIISDPAIFHLPFYIDRDAVHLVSESDIRNYYNKHMISTWNYKTGGALDFKKFLTCRLIIIKNSSSNS